MQWPLEKLNIIDIDIILDNDNTSRIHFLKKLAASSEANEYYDAEVVGQGGHLQIETVNRNACKEEIVDTEQEVYISAFPFSVEVGCSSPVCVCARGFLQLFHVRHFTLR